MSINPNKCQIITLPSFLDERGGLGFVEGGDTIPFEIKRIYYLYDVPKGKERGAHGHIHLQQLIIAMHGSFTIVLDDGQKKSEFILDDPSKGLYVSPMMWRDLKYFSEGTVCLVLASDHYQEEDYIRDYDQFVKVALS